MSGDATHTRAYEVNFDTGGNATLIRWNGGLGDYTFISPTFSASPSLGRLLQSGDVFMAQASGDRFQAWVNGQLVLTAFDSTYATGDPGIGFFIRDDVEADRTFQSLYGLTGLTVVDDGTSTDPRSGHGSRHRSGSPPCPDTRAGDAGPHGGLAGRDRLVCREAPLDGHPLTRSKRSAEDGAKKAPGMIAGAFSMPLQRPWKREPAMPDPSLPRPRS